VFPEPLKPSDLVPGNYPSLKRLLAQQVDMLFADLRLMLRLPAPSLEPDVGMNVTAAAMMMNIISGFSVWLFQTDEAKRIEAEEAKRKGQQKLSGQRFKGFVTAYWPRLDPEPEPAVVAARLYKVRNALAHALGVDDVDDPKARSVSLRKHALDPQDIVDALERNLAHPQTVPVIREEDEGVLVVNISALYWALYRMLAAAVKDKPAEIESAISRVSFPKVAEEPE
jgi:hypothetical protein